jgi:PQQ-dependent dehydrogenase (s-GDH family)
LVLIALLAMCVACTASPGGRPDGESGDQARPEEPPAALLGPPPTMRVLATGLDHPFELMWGPDNFLWTTERVGKRVARINPADGTTSTVLTVPDAADGSDGQHGLLGLAFGDRAVYLAYSYGPEDNLQGKIVRYSYDQAVATLRDPVDVITNLPASDEHNSGRLLFGPDQKLYYSIGDQGNNKSDHACEPIRAQNLPTVAQVAAKDWSTYQGKVLRLNPDGSIPEDNPLIHGVRSHVFTYGHRNPQGLAFGPGGQLLSAEHGPKSDDEINLLRPGANYGWPFVAGFRDDQSYWYANWSAAPDCARLDYDDYESPPSVPHGPRELEWNDPDYAEPLKTLYTVPNGHNFKDEACEEDMDHLCWPSIAPSSLDYLPAENAANPALANALILTSLKNGALYVAKLTQDGGSVQGDVHQLFRTRSRYRDVAAGPDRTKIYILTDSEGLAGPGSESESGELHNPGSIVEYTLTVPGSK